MRRVMRGIPCRITYQTWDVDLDQGEVVQVEAPSPDA